MRAVKNCKSKRESRGEKASDERVQDHGAEAHTQIERGGAKFTQNNTSFGSHAESIEIALDDTCKISAAGPANNHPCSH